MNQEKIKLFINLAETEHFHKTADACHVSPSKLSRTIKSLENELGAQLFERTNRSVELTVQGRSFLSFAREQIKQWETLKDTLQSHQGELSGSVSIYCSVTASYSFLYDILASFRSTYPLIHIKLHTGDPADAIERVSQGYEDLAIAAKPNQLPQNISFKQFAQSPLVFIVSKDDRRFTLQLREDADQGWGEIPMIVSERGLVRDRFNSWVLSKKITPNIYCEVSGNEAIVSMVSLGFGVGLVPKIVLENSPLMNKVKLFDTQPDILRYEVGACVQTRRLKSPIVSALWQLIS